jgi:hypothetical protein
LAVTAVTAVTVTGRDAPDAPADRRGRVPTEGFSAGWQSADPVLRGVIHEWYDRYDRYDLLVAQTGIARRRRQPAI